MEKDQNKFELVENRDAIDLVPTWELQWWWFAAAVAVIATIVLVVLLVRRKKIVPDPARIEREAFERARKDLEKLEQEEVEAPVQVSVILRRYLAESLGEPALFQTHEEFIGRHDALANFRDEVRTSIQEFFADLAAMKYAREGFETSQTDQLKNRSVELLERMHAA